LLDQRDAHTQGGENARVLDANDSSANHDQRARNRGHFQDLIAIDNGPGGDWHLRRGCRLGAGRNHNLFSSDLRRASRARYLKRFRVLKARDSINHIYTVSRELRLRNVDLGFNDVLYAEREIRHRDLLFYAIADAVDVLVVVAGQVQD